MKRILFPALLILTLLAGGVVAFAIWRATPASAEDSLKEGKKFFDEKDYATATIHLLNALQVDGAHRDARFMLVQSYLNQGDAGSAARELQKLLVYHPNDREANLMLGSIYIAAFAVEPQALPEADKIAKKLLALNDKDPDALILAGNVAVGRGDLAESLKNFQDAVNLDPKNSNAFVNLGMTQARQKQFADAEKTFLRAKELDPKNRYALIALANYYRLANAADKREAVLKEAAALYPEDPAVYGNLVQLYNESGRIDDAVKLLRDAQAKNPAEPSPTFLLSDLYTVRNRPAEARQVLIDLKKTMPEDLRFQTRVGKKLALNLMTDQPARAQIEIDEVLKNNPNDPEGMLLAGKLNFQLRKYDDAEKVLSHPDAANSRIAEIQYLLGALKSRKLQLEAATEHYQKALALNPNYLQAKVALAGTMIDRGRPQDARAEINNILQVYPTYGGARLVKGIIDRVEKRYADAEKEFNALLKEDPSNADIIAQLAETYFAQGRIAEAEKGLLQALELQPSFERLQKLTQFYVTTKQPDKAIQRISAVPESEKQTSHYELLGSVYGSMGKVPEAEAAYKKVVEKDPKNFTADYALANLYMQAGRSAEALPKLNTVIEKSPNNETAHTVRGMLLESQGKLEEAKADYKRALEINPNTDIAANNLAYTLAEEGKDLDVALTLAQNVKRRHPDDPAIADTMGWVYHKFGNNELALDQLKFAVSKTPDHPTFQYHLGMIYKDMKRPKEAAEALRKAANSPKEFKERALAQDALKGLPQ